MKKLETRIYNPCEKCESHLTKKACWEGCSKLQEWNSYILKKHLGGSGSKTDQNINIQQKEKQV